MTNAERSRRGVSRKAKLRTKAPVNVGRNYNGPKVAKFLVGQVRSRRCLNEELGEVVVPVQMLGTRSRTERPHEPSLYSGTGDWLRMRSIAGSLGGPPSGRGGGTSEIPVLRRRSSNPAPWIRGRDNARGSV